eukprot:2062771-Amphidinium_carterae.1
MPLVAIRTAQASHQPYCLAMAALPGAQVAERPVMSTELAIHTYAPGGTLYDFLVFHGAQSRNDLRSISTQQSVISRRAKTLLDHNHSHGKAHVCDSAANVRLACARCHMTSTFAYKIAWLRQPCTTLGTGVCHDFDVLLESQIGSAMSLCRAVNQLYRHCGAAYLPPGRNQIPAPL